MLFLQVLTLPPGAIRLATSPTAVNELWCYGPNVLASQFHLEFDEPLVLEKIWKTLRDVGRLDEQQAAESRRVLEAGGQQNAGMLQVRVWQQQQMSWWWLTHQAAVSWLLEQLIAVILCLLWCGSIRKIQVLLKRACRGAGDGITG